MGNGIVKHTSLNVNSLTGSPEHIISAPVDSICGIFASKPDLKELFISFLRKGKWIERFHERADDMYNPTNELRYPQYITSTGEIYGSKDHPKYRKVGIRAMSYRSNLSHSISSSSLLIDNKNSKKKAPTPQLVMVSVDNIFLLVIAVAIPIFLQSEELIQWNAKYKTCTSNAVSLNSSPILSRQSTPPSLENSRSRSRLSPMNSGINLDDSLEHSTGDLRKSLSKRKFLSARMRLRQDSDSEGSDDESHHHHRQHHNPHTVHHAPLHHHAKNHHEKIVEEDDDDAISHFKKHRQEKQSLRKQLSSNLSGTASPNANNMHSSPAQMASPLVTARTDKVNKSDSFTGSEKEASQDHVVLARIENNRLVLDTPDVEQDQLIETNKGESSPNDSNASTTGVKPRHERLRKQNSKLATGAVSSANTPRFPVVNQEESLDDLLKISTSAMEIDILMPKLSNPDWLQELFQYVDAFPYAITIAAVTPTPGNASSFDYCYCFVNQAFETLTQFTRTHVLGRNCASILYHKQKTEEAQVTRINDSLFQRKSCKVALTCQCRDGSTFFNLLALRPVVNGQGDFVYVVAVHYDAKNSAIHAPPAPTEAETTDKDNAIDKDTEKVAGEDTVSQQQDTSTSSSATTNETSVSEKNVANEENNVDKKQHQSGDFAEDLMAVDSLLTLLAGILM